MTARRLTAVDSMLFWRAASTTGARDARDPTSARDPASTAPA